MLVPLFLISECASAWMNDEMNNISNDSEYDEIFVLYLIDP